MSGSASRRNWRLLRKADASHKVLEARVGAERVNPKIGLEEVGHIGGPLTVSLLQKTKSLFFIAESGVDRRDHVGRNITLLRLLQ